jgi:hypothetical protein
VAEIVLQGSGIVPGKLIAARMPQHVRPPIGGLSWARTLHSFAQLRQNRQNQLLFEVPMMIFPPRKPDAGHQARSNG